MIFRIVIYLLKEVTNLRVLMCYIDNSLLNYYRQQVKSHRANQSLNRFPIKAVADRELGHSVRLVVSAYRSYVRFLHVEIKQELHHFFYTICVYRPTGQCEGHKLYACLFV